MKAIADLIISLIEYLKAEVAEAQCSLYGLLVGFFLLFASMIFGIAALTLVLGSMYAGLRTGMGPASAALLTAVLSFMISGGLAWLAWLKFQK